MIKQSTTAGSPYALLAVTPTHGIHFQYGFNQDAAGPATAPPNTWLKLTRTGNTITSFTSTDGQTWTAVGSTTLALTGDASIGLFVTSHNGSALSTATFDNVSVTKGVVTPALPAPWTGSDIGAPTLSGSATHSAGTFTVNGAGNDIWADAVFSIRWSELAGLARVGFCRCR